MLQESRRRKAKTILITGKNKEDYSEFCDEMVLIPSLKYLNYGNIISPQFPILIMLDLIYSYYVKQDKIKKAALHDNTVKALKGEKDENY